MYIQHTKTQKTQKKSMAETTPPLEPKWLEAVEVVMTFWLIIGIGLTIRGADPKYLEEYFAYAMLMFVMTVAYWVLFAYYKYKGARLTSWHQFMLIVNSFAAKYMLSELITLATQRETVT
jgi:hypothetical protein